MVNELMIFDIKNMQKRPQAQKPIFLGPESDKSEIWFQILKNLKNI